MEDKKTVQFDFNNMMAGVIVEENGINERELKEIESVASQFAKELKTERTVGKLQFLELPYDEKTATEILETVNSIKGRFKNLVVVGLGGSSLGNIAIHTALNHPFYNLLSEKERGGFPRIFVLDNIDPDRFAEIGR